MIALNVAPGLKRNFVCESWPGMDCRIWSRAREEAYDMVKKDIIPDISGCDIDPKALELSVIHAREAGIEKYIRFTKADVSDFTSEKKYGFIVTNPPYGERLMDKKETERLYKNIRRVIDKLNTWSFYIITSYPDFEKTFGKKADKRRKLYNGRIECQYYQYLGPKPENI